MIKRYPSVDNFDAATSFIQWNKEVLKNDTVHWSVDDEQSCFFQNCSDLLLEKNILTLNLQKFWDH